MGGATIVSVLIVVRFLQRLEFRRYGEMISDASLDLLAGLAAGIVLGAVFGWRRSRPLGNEWQRGVIALLAVFGAVIVGFLATPFHIVLGVPGVALLGVLSLTLALAGSRWAMRGAGQDTGEGRGA